MSFPVVRVIITNRASPRAASHTAGVRMKIKINGVWRCVVSNTHRTVVRIKASIRSSIESKCRRWREIVAKRVTNKTTNNIVKV